jgi:hypothetical protein
MGNTLYQTVCGSRQAHRLTGSAGLSPAPLSGDLSRANLHTVLGLFPSEYITGYVRTFYIQLRVSYEWGLKEALCFSA